jgi:hypothetical protein
MEGLPADVPLFLDLASPPLVASRSERPRFFSGGHPLTSYISRFWRSFPAADSSGGNVTYAALSLADSLGARRIDLYGADFSYPRGQSYARGTYLFPYFDHRQGRLNPLESLFSAFLYRSPSLKRVGQADRWYYETRALNMYRERLEAKARTLKPEIVQVCGLGAPIRLEKAPGVSERTGPHEWSGGQTGGREPIRLFSAGKAAMGARDFLAGYRKKIADLPLMDRGVSAWLQRLSAEETMLLATLLPAAAALNRRSPGLKGGDVLEAVREYSLMELDRVLGA